MREVGTRDHKLREQEGASELIIPMSIHRKIKNFRPSTEAITLKVGALVDTGARVAIVKTGLLPETWLTTPPQPKRFVSAGGGHIPGGEKGAHVSTVFTVRTKSGEKKNHRVNAFFYEADITDDVILSYKFLKKNRLVIIPGHDCIMTETDLDIPPATPGCSNRVTTDTEEQISPMQQETPEEDCGPPSTSSTLIPQTDAGEAPVRDPAMDTLPTPARVVPYSLSGTRGVGRVDKASSEDVWNLETMGELPASQHPGTVYGLETTDADNRHSGGKVELEKDCTECNNRDDDTGMGRGSFPEAGVNGSIGSPRRTMSSVTHTTESSSECGCTEEDLSDFGAISSVRPDEAQIPQSGGEWHRECPIEPATLLTYRDAPAPTESDLDRCGPSRFRYDKPKKRRKFVSDKQKEYLDMESKLHKPDGKETGRLWKTESYAVINPVRDQILQWAGFTPTIDAFAERCNARFPRYWDKSMDAFRQDWGPEVLWVNAPFSEMDQVVNKIVASGARGIMIVPVWRTKAWFQALQHIAVKWIDLPKEVDLYRSNSGRIYPQRWWTTRAVVFDGEAAREDYRATYRLHRLDHRDEHTLGHYYMGHSEEYFDRVDREISAHWVRSKTSPSLIRSVVEENQPFPESDQAKLRVQQKYKHVLFEKKLAKNVSVASRGKFAQAFIRLKDPKVTPKKCHPFRLTGDREQGLKTLVNQFLENGWIQEVKGSEWASRAFVVPKPETNKWRCVIDYRDLNALTQDDAGPIPNIEDTIADQAKNKIWSVLDLEWGFHQMHLEEESRKYTTFVTPWATYEWTVLPMGVKNGPSMFQRLVKSALEHIPECKVYIDDIIIGTGGETTEEIVQNHERVLGQVMEALANYNLTVKGEKCHLFQEEVKFCGHILRNGTRRAAPSKLLAIEKWQSPSVNTVTKLKGFLGLT